ncbi:MAG TPA: DUF6340 family protein [Prolixibacteraceae bacterium]|nr:DUF6340 family protein [Prolixibacteraceae bacterium]
MMQLFKKIISYRGLIIFMTGILLVSCKSYYAALTIENIQPAKEELPSDIQSLTLMNRSMNNQFLNHQVDSLQMYFYRNNYQLSKIVLDSTAVDTTVQALAALLFESGRYDVVVPVERNIYRSLFYEILPDTLNPDQVKKICTDYNTDALMVLERFSTKTMADYSAEKYNDPTTGTNYSFYATLDLKYNAFFRIYKPGNKTWIKEIELTDTIYWESADFSQERLFSKLPSIKQALINAGIKVALDMDDKLSPTWIPEKRGYFLFKTKGDRGQQFMNENNTEEAAKYWREMAQSENKKIRSKAEYNLALIGELNGDIDAAIDWGLKSFYSYYRHQTETYLKKLKIRKETIQKTE